MSWTLAEVTLPGDAARGARVFHLTSPDTDERLIVEVTAQDNTALPDETPIYSARETPSNNAGLAAPILDLAIALRAQTHRATLKAPVPLPAAP